MKRLALPEFMTATVIRLVHYLLIDLVNIIKAFSDIRAERQLKISAQQILILQEKDFPADWLE